MNEILMFLSDANIEHTINHGGRCNYVTLSFKLHDMEFNTYIDNETTLDEFKSTINEDFKMKLINQKEFHLRMAKALENTISTYIGVF